MDKAYDPQATEQNIYKLWEEGGYFAPRKLGVNPIYDSFTPAQCQCRFTRRPCDVRG